MSQSSFTDEKKVFFFFFVFIIKSLQFSTNISEFYGLNDFNEISSFN